MRVNRVVKISNLSFSYNGVSILNDVSLSIENEITCILAPTGAGKTTLLNIISGILAPQKGNVVIDGLTPQEAVKNKKIGFSFQESTLLEWNTVLENVLLPLQIGLKKKITSKEKSFASELIKLVGLSSYENNKCSELSGGMKQRVGLARALVTNPEIILFDEPFNKLDFITKIELLIEFRKILKEKNVSCVVVTHNIEDAVFIGDKTLIFSKTPFSLRTAIRTPLKHRDKSTLSSEQFLKTVSIIKKAIL
jgi:NitT/TauT family transport system ATP-binding protein